MKLSEHEKVAAACKDCCVLTRDLYLELSRVNNILFRFFKDPSVESPELYSLARGATGHLSSAITKRMLLAMDHFRLLGSPDVQQHIQEKVESVKLSVGLGYSVAAELSLALAKLEDR